MKPVTRWVIKATSTLSGIPVWWNEDTAWWDSDPSMATWYELPTMWTKVTLPVVEGVLKYTDVRIESIQVDPEELDE